MTPVDQAMAEIVLRYWQERAHVTPRSELVKERHLKRIGKRLAEGFSVRDLERCVDVACYDEFYLDHGYHKMPDVIFRNAERIERLLTLAKHEQSRPIPL